MNNTDRIVVVGGGLASARACAALRRKGHAGDLVLISAEPHSPYDRPPLSKDVLAGKRESTELQFDADELAVRVRTSMAATGLDLDRRKVLTTRGDEPFDRLLIATGAAPILLPGDGEQLPLRTIDDALAVRCRLRPGARIVVIGASWIGAEVATVAVAAGCHVTCVEAGPAPLAAALGDRVGSAMLRWWREVDLRLDSPVAEVGHGEVLLVDGTRLPADAVVTGVGVRPSTGWLAGSGVEVNHGVHVDEHMLTGVDGVAAVGDVAARWSPRLGRRLLVEHWDEAGAAPLVAAASLLAGDGDELPVYDPVPYFWSDQFGRKVQYVGDHDAEDAVHVELQDDAVLAAARWFDAEGRMTAWVGVDRVKEMIAARKSIGTVVPRAAVDATGERR